MKFFFANITIFLTGLLLSLGLAAPVSAYTGVYVVSPTVVGGPDHVTVTQFDLETSGPEHTAVINTNLTYVHSITITMDEETDAHILIKEYPEGSDQTFDIIVPQPVQNHLVSATVTIWAPDTEPLLVRHEHQGDPTTFEPATKVQPEQVDAYGNVLWTFTVTSFSSFTFMKNEQTTLMPNRHLGVSAFMSLGLLAIAAIGAPLALRRN